jgi:hypothetical protein
MKKLLLVFATIVLALGLVYLPELFHPGRPVTKPRSGQNPDTAVSTVKDVVQSDPAKNKNSDYDNAPASPASRKPEKARGVALSIDQIKIRLNETSITGSWTTFQEMEQSLSGFPAGSENYTLSQKAGVLKKIAALRSVYCNALKNQGKLSAGSKSNSEIQKIVFEQIQYCLVTGVLSDEQSTSVSNWLQNPVCP